jgi:hypothetical protein
LEIIATDNGTNVGMVGKPKKLGYSDVPKMLTIIKSIMLDKAEKVNIFL